MTEIEKIMKSKSDTANARTISAVARDRKHAAVQSEKVCASDAFAAAEKIIRSGTKLDMAALANELGIGRATLYRWTGDRETLIKQVLATYLRDSFDWHEGRLNKEKIIGAERIVKFVAGIMKTLTKSKPVRSFLRNEPDVALRILTGSGAPSLQDATTSRLIEMIEDEVAKGRYQPKLEPELLAYTVVRLVDSFVYGDIIAGIEVDLVRAGRIIQSLI